MKKATIANANVNRRTRPKPYSIYRSNCD